MGDKVWNGTNKSLNEILDETDYFLEQLPADERNARVNGKHWTPLESLWTVADHEISADDFDAICREEGQGALYSNCYEHVDKKMSIGSRSGSTNQIGNVHKVDAFGNLAGTQAAHLLSHAEVCHKAFGFLGQAAVGKYFDDKTCSLLPVSSAPKTKRRKVLMGVRGVQLSSLKGNKYNKFYLKLQGSYFDTETPSILVIPILPLPEVKNWARSAEVATEYEVLAVAFGEGSRLVHQEVLKNSPKICTAADIEIARTLLDAFVKGIAGSIKKNNVLENFNQQELSSSKNASLIRWKALVERIQGGSEANVPVPTPWSGTESASIVAKARLTTGNSLPDPWLLALKSAINYSSYNGKRLMPACPSDLESDEDPPNTTQVMDFNEQQYDVDAVALLAASMERGGKTVELFSDGLP